MVINKILESQNEKPVERLSNRIQFFHKNRTSINIGVGGVNKSTEFMQPKILRNQVTSSRQQFGSNYGFRAIDKFKRLKQTDKI